MFEVPNAKRIKRSDFEAEHHNDNASADGSSLSIDINDSAQSNLKAGEAPIDYGFEYEFITPQTGPHKPPAEQVEDDQNYEFRLFSAPREDLAADQRGTAPAANDQVTATTPHVVQVITLTRSPSPTSAPAEPEGRFLRPRPTAHYLAEPSSTTKAQYAATAISSATLTSLSLTPWPGTALPWRITHIPTSRLHKSLRSDLLTSKSPYPIPPPRTQPNRRPKPSKKRRNLLRQRLAARLRSQPKPKPTKIVNEKGELELDLPPDEREKRTARNREKKVKRRQRERERKAAGASGAADEDDGGDGGGCDEGVAGED